MVMESSNFSTMEMSPLAITPDPRPHPPHPPHAYLLDVSHNASLGLDVQLFDSLNELLFPLTLRRVYTS